MKRIHFFLIGLFQILTVSSQTFPSQTLKQDFLSEVKSLEEFQARFNGTESKPDIANDENQRKNNLIKQYMENFADLVRWQLQKVDPHIGAVA